MSLSIRDQQNHILFRSEVIYIVRFLPYQIYTRLTEPPQRKLTENIFCTRLFSDVKEMSWTQSQPYSTAVVLMSEKKRKSCQ